jgi:zinc protease
MIRFGLAALACSTALGVTSGAVARTAPPAKPQPAASSAKVLPTTSYRLPNGLKVVFHIDQSDPVVAVALAAHVGSARETPGRTGFAHMFEHLFFLNSENLGPGGLDKLSARVGGSGANGFTTQDVTVYHQEVPNDALEKMIWAEADKLGFFIKTVTDPVLAKEKQVVKNEKRQSYDNRPYGHVGEIITDAMFPADHPYSWEVIGSMRDLDAAELKDVQDFYRRWYVPNNATLVVAGNFDEAQARGWIERYFGEIARGAPTPNYTPRPANLAASKSLMYEDSYAKLPMLTISWPGIQSRSADQPALEVLAQMLTDGRDTPLTRLLVEEKKLTDEVGATHRDGALTGEFRISVRAFDGVPLDQVQAAITEGLKRFETSGVDPAILARAKAKREADLYGALTTVEDKATTIARLDVTTGDANYFDTYLGQVRALTPADIQRVYRTYIAGKPNISVSAVPRGQAKLALTGATTATFPVEPIVQGAEAAVEASKGAATYARTPSKIDRSKEPAAGPTPQVTLPTIWQASASDGLALSGIEDRELPVATFELAIDGGQRFDDPAKPGAANLLARMMTRGTAKRTAAELEAALQSLGATVTVTSDRERVRLRGTTLSRNFAETMALVREMLLEPRWDPNELALAKAAVTAEIADERANPQAIARKLTNAVTYKGSVIALDPKGTAASVAALSMDDLKQLKAKFSPAIARLRVVGAVSQAEVTASVAPLAAGWAKTEVAVPLPPQPVPARPASLLFYDVPDAKQSLLMFTARGPRRADPDYYPATVANYILGGGGFASRLTQQLREGKGYTYGVRSRYEGWLTDGMFLLETPVRANVTLEAATLARDIVRDYPTSFTADDLAVTKSFLTKSRAIAYEAQADKLNMLAVIGDYGLPLDYPLRQAAYVDALTEAQVREIAAKYLRPSAMTYVVVGDAATQRSRMTALGVGEPVAANGLLP